MTTDAAMWHTVREHLYAALVAAQQQRDQRPGLVNTASGGLECEWVGYERSVMLGQVNRHRRALGLPEVDPAVIVRAEGQAAGHVDYTSKYATNCAEIALDLGHWTKVTR